MLEQEKSEAKSQPSSFIQDSITQKFPEYRRRLSRRDFLKLTVLSGIAAVDTQFVRQTFFPEKNEEAERRLKEFDSTHTLASNSEVIAAEERVKGLDPTLPVETDQYQKDRRLIADEEERQ